MNRHPDDRPSHALVADLERTLGDPGAAGGPFSHAETVEHEERGALPPGAVDLIRSWGFARYLVPEEFGGGLRNLEQLVLLTRSLARRNLTVAVMFGSALLGVNPVWLWGDEEQRARVAQGLLGGDLACFAVSEPDHGSDLGTNETTAVPDGDGYLLTGEKWPVGNATRGRFLTVYAAVEGAGPSLLLVDKQALPPGSWDNHPFVRTVGLRGHDLSGITFRDTKVPAGALLGRPGGGLTGILQVLQITRTAIGALSIGTMDSVLRIALRHARERVLYGQEIYRIPVIRRHLVRSHLDLLIAECVTLPVARSLSVAPSRLSLWSSVVKYLVPTLGEEVVQEAGRVLGARGYLREGVAGGVFQKLQRDHAIASVFEGTTHVNLHSIASQLPAVARVADRPAPGADTLLRRLFDWSDEAPVWQPSGRALRLTNASEDEITRGWGPAVAEARLIAERQVPAAEADALRKVLDAWSARRAAFYTRIAAESLDPATTDGQDRATEHCVHHAAASCLYTWLYSFAEERATAPGTGWLVLVLQRLLRRLDPTAEPDESLPPWLEELMFARLDGPEYFSLQAVKAAAAAAG
ncbi:acyl-CoA dehydrogenase family protein [Streptomyces sparsogenes]|uniref:Acyl-CoA dehydrogenase domain-containing protein n=1 Tax=Streptomyces sparsogenes DSM 40356 TaxID=1331668 RepID=A0A1R1SDA6_9ACTN|nr:acyl-CoA dehydrogenase family protein [Streptomyces sparsogenes]OMI36192.1 acyl-CoA dehydrogenase domain-containing protein [Streptomyces sparsogenes DSM 40356]